MIKLRNRELGTNGIDSWGCLDLSQGMIEPIVAVDLLKNVLREECVLGSTGCFIMNATKVFLNNFYSKAPYELKLVPYFH